MFESSEAHNTIHFYTFQHKLHSTRSFHYFHGLTIRDKAFWIWVLYPTNNAKKKHDALLITPNSPKCLQVTCEIRSVYHLDKMRTKLRKTYIYWWINYRCQINFSTNDETSIACSRVSTMWVLRTHSHVLLIPHTQLPYNLQIQIKFAKK